MIGWLLVTAAVVLCWAGIILFLLSLLSVTLITLFGLPV